MKKLLIALIPLALSGCIASVAKTVVTTPFMVAGKAVDVATTSQDEADRNRGRKMRKAEEKARRDAHRN